MRPARALPLTLLTTIVLVQGTPRAATTTHTVEVGDTLWSLARGSGCTVAQLRDANNLDPEDPLLIGAQIVLPACPGATGLEHVVAKGETISGIAQHYGVSMESLEAINDLDATLRVGERLRLPSDAGVAWLRAGQSVGEVDAGSLSDPTQLPHSAAYYRRRLPRTYATEHLVRHVVRVVEGVRARRPGVHRLAVGDLSDTDGGPLTGHRTHQSGRDVDLGFYFLDEPEAYPEEFAPATRDNLDVAATWDLLEGFVVTAKQPGGVLLVYLDYEIQRLLYPAALRDGWTKDQLAEVFEYPDGRGASGRVVQHLWNHHDHLHVRFRCPPKDASCE